MRNRASEARSQLALLAPWNDNRAKNGRGNPRPFRNYTFAISIVAYAWLEIALPSAACAAARRAIGTR